MAYSSSPWAPPVGDATYGTPQTESEYRALFGGVLGDGIVNDTSGGGFSASLQSGGTVVRISGSTLYMSLRGHLFNSSTSVDFTPTVTGTQPSSSAQERTDLLVATFDPAASTPATKVVLEMITGTVGAYGATAPPAITRTASGKWQVPLWEWTRRGGSPITTLTDRRAWIGPNYTANSWQGFPTNAPIGSTGVVDGSRWWRKLVSGTATWVGGSPAYEGFTNAGFTFPDGPFSLLLSLVDVTRDGGITKPTAQRIRVPYTGSYRIDAQCRWSNPLGNASCDVISDIRLNSADSPAGGSSLRRSTALVFPGHSVTTSLFRSTVPLTAGDYLQWFVTAGISGSPGLVLTGGLADNSLSIRFND